MQDRTRDTRRTLIAAASDLLARGGPAHVTLRAVGAAADVSRTAPYRHFQDKDDLLSTVAAENLTALKAEMQRAVADTATDSTPLFRACLAYVQVAWEYPNHYRLEFGGDYAINPSRALVDAAQDFTDYFNELVVEAQQSNTLIAGDVREVGPLLWVLLHGLAMSNHLVADHTCEPGTGYQTEDMHRVLALALRNLAPR
ncbi:AcrR family transcriptional regulator [Rhodococcus sp. PvR044]|uniref:TetR/AcrR family transcriptional regulator n=1 Tax=Rhodococcus TaxID=1827 RepID=UPI001AE9A78F|nr:MULTISPECIES: TetR/AcrR family transcriptional regulator [Rhodococcus]MBP1161994.1 AcrR family transcriptional regulator [Rhodococcus sp. PvR099]MCZ4557752.1 TetR/AcrR family transcriptional regulator [Rhodococcus maanshanensis]